MKLIKTDLRGLNALQVLMRARIVYRGMKDNPLFPSPTPSLADFKAGIDRLAESVGNTYNGGSKLEYVLKQKHLDEMSALIKSMAAYVSIVAQGDNTIVLAAGFEQRKSSAPINKLSAPQGLRSSTGAMNGSIKVRWKPVRGARMYRVYVYKGYASTAIPVRDLVITPSSCTFEGLEPLEYYTFQVQAIGARAVSPISNISTALSIGLKPAISLAASNDRLSLRA